MQTTPDQLLPVLKPEGYRSNEPLAFTHPLLKDVNGCPVVAYGYDVGQVIIYEPAKDAQDLASRMEEMKALALANLRKRPVRWDVTQVQGSTLVAVSGDEYASEHILDKEFLLEIGRRLNAEMYVLGVPGKGKVFAAGYASELGQKLPFAIRSNYDNHVGSPKISRNAFMVVNGEIVAMAGDASEMTAKNPSRPSMVHPLPSRRKWWQFWK